MPWIFANWKVRQSGLFSDSKVTIGAHFSVSCIFHLKFLFLLGWSIYFIIIAYVTNSCMATGSATMVV